MRSSAIVRVPLGDLVTIRSGYQDLTRNKRTGRVPGGQLVEAALLTPTCLSEAGSIDFDAIETITLSRAALEKHQLEDRDILFQYRGNSFNAVSPSFLTPAGLRVVPSYVFMHLRVDPDHGVDPCYLEWYLSQRTTQAELDSIVRGTNVKRVSARDLRSFEIRVPTAEIQQRIVSLHTNLCWYLDAQVDEASHLREWVEAETRHMLRSAEEGAGNAD